MRHLFTPKLESVGRLAFPSDQVAEEPMLFSASPEYAHSYGGPITRAVLAELESCGGLRDAARYSELSGAHLIIDTRSHMLMPGQYPAIPGWHCDAYPRVEYSSQPSIEAGDPECFHFVMVMSDNQLGVSKPRYIVEPIEVEIDKRAVWSSVHKAVEALPDLEREYQEDGLIFRFGQETIHSASPCHERGWRYFFRLSPLRRPPQNKIRRQVQVYAPLGGGW